MRQSPLKENECGIVAAEVEQPVERVLDVLDIAAAGTQDALNNRRVFPHRLSIQRLEAVGKAADGFRYGLVVAHWGIVDNLSPRNESTRSLNQLDSQLRVVSYQNIAKLVAIPVFANRPTRNGTRIAIPHQDL
jgi:hypothetical protein